MNEQADEQLSSAAIERRRLRQAMIARREAMPAAIRAEAQHRINARLTRWLESQPPGIIAFCWPIRGEVDCLPTIEALLGRGWQAAIPTVVGLAQAMEFRSWWPTAPLGSDPYGIPVPLTAAIPRPDIVLAPLVAFDAAGYRLGYGGGYFDRTLASLAPRPLTIGVGYACCAVNDLRPTPHDIPMDILVTENYLKFT